MIKGKTNKILLFIICSLIAVSLWYFVVEHPLRPIKVDTSVHSVETFHSIAPQSIEVLVLGSSHAWCGIDTRMLRNEYGIYGYNYGCAWQHVNTTKLFLQDALLTQSPKTVILDTDVFGEPMLDVSMCGEVYYTKKIGKIRDKLEYLDSCFNKKIDRYITYIFPAIMFHENWKELQEENFMANSNETDFFVSCGYLGTDSIEEVSLSDCDKMEQSTICDATMKYLDEIVDICDKNGIRLILCTLPYQGEISYEDAARQYSQEKNLEYINFFDKSIRDEIGLDELNDFRNEEHLNDTGARKVTEYIRERL